MLLFIGSQISLSQTVEIIGVIESNDDVENIHIINKTSQKFTVSNSDGKFKIAVKLNDTLVISSVQNKLKIFTVNQDVILSKSITIKLEEQINQLDEVVIGNVFSGDLLSDVKSIKEEPISAKKLGIPSYQGKPMTQSQRRLHEATTGGGFLPLTPILNAISGRTKKLKNQIKLEANEVLMYSLKSKFSKDLFYENPLDEDLIMDYFYFCSEDQTFLTRCKGKSDLEAFAFLKEKLVHYKRNREENKN